MATLFDQSEGIDHQRGPQECDWNKLSTLYSVRKLETKILDHGMTWDQNDGASDEAGITPYSNMLGNREQGTVRHGRERM